MADSKFPGPNYNRLIENDSQIVKVPMDNMGWGARTSIFGRLNGDPKGQNPAKPTAPEMTIKHVRND